MTAVAEQRTKLQVSRRSFERSLSSSAPPVFASNMSQGLSSLLEEAQLPGLFTEHLPSTAQLCA